jgi:glycosyltransferase involved in cell wall biosynthesis
MMHVALNALLLAAEPGYRSAGIHHYIEQLTRHLPAAAPDLAFSVWLSRAVPAGRLAGAGLRERRPAWSTERPLARIAWEQTAQPLALMRARADLAHALAYVSPLLCPCPSVVTVYDLSFMRTPERFRPANRWYLRAFTRWSCRRARRVLAISESTRRDVINLLGVSPARVDVAYPGVDPVYRPLPRDAVERFRLARGLPERFILYLGTIEPRKNLVTLIDAYARLHTDRRLVLAGARGWLYDEVFARVAALGLDGDVLFPGYVPAAELAFWYNAAEVFAYPSAYEGFGMPVAEALACGTPVVTTDVSALPEAAGPVGLQVPAGDAEALAGALAGLLDSPEARASARLRGPAWTARFSWEATARATAAAYRRAREDRGG